MWVAGAAVIGALLKGLDLVITKLIVLGARLAIFAATAVAPILVPLAALAAGIGLITVALKFARRDTDNYTDGLEDARRAADA